MSKLFEDNIKVEAYRNLHNGKYSIKALEGPFKGRVVAHADEVYILSPEFVVSQAGRARVLRERKKYVHAVVRGELFLFAGNTRVECEAVEYLRADSPTSYRWILGEFHRDMQINGREFTYNPYKYDSFVVHHNFQPKPIAFGVGASLSTTHGTRVTQPTTFDLEEI